MLPLRDTIQSRSFPFVTWLLIGANTLVFLLMISMNQAGRDQFFLTFALLPQRVDLFNPLTYFPFFSHMFLHGGWIHILSNMWTLFIFGDNVEDRMGSGRFLVFYLLGGLAAGGLQYMVNPSSTVPAVGASGAIAAVLGAYFLFFPRAQVITLIPIFIIPWLINVPAVLYLGFWFVTQLFSGTLSLITAAGATAGGVAWWAHIGGFVFGLLAAFPFSGRRSRPRSYADEYYPW